MNDKLIEEIALKYARYHSSIEAATGMPVDCSLAAQFRKALREYAAATSAAGQQGTGAISPRVDKPSAAPAAPHAETDKCGFDRNGSHSAGYYVCLCGWEDVAPHAERRKGEKERREGTDVGEWLNVKNNNKRTGPADRRQAHSEFWNSEQAPKGE